MQCLNLVHSTGKYSNRGQQHPALLWPAWPLTL